VFAGSLLAWNLISLINMIIFFAIRFVAPTRGMSVMTVIFYLCIGQVSIILVQ
jgi:hypothetical protein